MPASAKVIQRASSQIDVARIRDFVVLPFVVSESDGDEAIAFMPPIMEFAADEEIKPANITRTIYALCTFIARRHRHDEILKFKVRVFKPGDAGAIDVDASPIKFRYIAVFPCSSSRDTADAAVESVLDGAASARVREIIKIDVGESVAAVVPSDLMMYIKEPAAGSLRVSFDASSHGLLPPHRGGRREIKVAKDSHRRAVVVIDALTSQGSWLSKMVSLAKEKGIDLDSLVKVASN